MAEIGEAQRFISAMETHFSGLHTEMVARVREIVSIPLPEGAGALLLTYFCDSFEEMSLPVTASAIRGTDDPEWLEWPGMPSEPIFPSPPLNRFPESDHRFDPYSIAIKVTGNALFRAWVDAGGQDYQYAAYFAEHDDAERLNLQTGQWEPSP